MTVLLLIHCDLEYADHHSEVSMTCSAPDLFHSEVSCKRISLLKLYFVRDKKNSVLELSFYLLKTLPKNIEFLLCDESGSFACMFA